MECRPPSSDMLKLHNWIPPFYNASNTTNETEARSVNVISALAYSIVWKQSWVPLNKKRVLDSFPHNYFHLALIINLPVKYKKDSEWNNFHSNIFFPPKMKLGTNWAFGFSLWSRVRILIFLADMQPVFSFKLNFHLILMHCFTDSRVLFHLLILTDKSRTLFYAHWPQSPYMSNILSEVKMEH